MSSATELTIAFTLDTPPYVMKKGTTGIELDIVRGALEPAGYTFTVEQMPYGALDLAVTRQQLDAATTVKVKKDGTYYSGNYVVFHNYAITRKGDGLKIEKISDLKGRSIVAWENAYKDLGPEFEEMFKPASLDAKYNEIADQREQVKMFWNGEAQVIVIDGAVFQWFTREMAAAGEIDESPDLDWHKIFPPVTEFCISFKDEKVRDAFTTGFERMKAAGQIEEIYDKYLK